jgi:hypothetical protein
MPPKLGTVSDCPVASGEADHSENEGVDGAWRDLGLSAPARRALTNAKLYKLEDLATVSRSELKSLHGMGPSTLKVLIPAMEASGISFRK